MEGVDISTVYRSAILERVKQNAGMSIDVGIIVSSE